MEQAALYQAVGENIRRLRTARGLKQGDLAGLVGLSRASVTNVELGRQRLLVDQLFRFAEVLGCPPAALLPRAERSATAAEKPVSPELSAWLDDIAAGR